LLPIVIACTGWVFPIMRYPVIGATVPALLDQLY
jgi:hypothetical protein